MKYFISYTMRDGIIEIIFLKRIKAFYSIKNIDTYIDVLDNTATNKQKFVIENLCSSNKLILIETIGSYDSKWVLKELEIASKRNIPIEIIKYEKFIHILNSIKNL